MPKFFVKDNQIKDNKILITGQDVNHIANVLRLKENDELCICNVDKEENYNCTISNINKDIIECEIVSKIKKTEEMKETNINITIFQGIPKAEKMELIIQKCTELGVKEITPVKMEHCVVKLDGKNAIKKIERWQKIAESAAKQSGRDNICKINNVLNIENVCNLIQNYDILLVPYENEKTNSFKKVLKLLEVKDNSLSIAIVIGPEGGFSQKEIELLEGNGGNIITLGKRILRTETVAIAMASSIMYEFGNLG